VAPAQKVGFLGSWVSFYRFLAFALVCWRMLHEQHGSVEALFLLGDSPLGYFGTFDFYFSIRFFGGD